MRPHGLANRPGNPYPATLRIQWTRRESNPHCQHARLASSRWTTGPANQSGEWGSNPRSPAPKAGGLPLSYPLHEWTAGESHPDFRLATAASSCWTSSPKEVRPGIEPGLPRLPGRRAAATLPDLPVAEAGFEPAWERLLRPCSCLTPVHSAVQYPRQDSNLRSSPCKGAAVAAGPRGWEIEDVGIEDVGIEDREQRTEDRRGDSVFFVLCILAEEWTDEAIGCPLSSVLCSL